MKKAPDIFIAYSHNDLRFKEELKKFLRPLLNTKRASLWDDYDIEAGKEWEAEIKKRLYAADIILLLVSPDSLASDYFYGREVSVSLERHEKGEAVVVPVIIRPCAWTITPLSKLEALPAKGKPVTKWSSEDEAFTDIAHSIGDIVETIAETRRKTAAEALQRQEFLAAVQAAEHLLDKSNWIEAARAYREAVRLYRPGFSPDVAALQNRITECETHQKQASENLIAAERRATQERTLAQEREAAWRRKLAEAEKHLERRAWAKARTAAQAALQLDPENEAAMMMLNRANAELENVLKPDNSRLKKPLIYAGGALLMLTFLVWMLLSQSKQEEVQSPEEIAAREEARAWQVADSIGTLPVLRDYEKQFPQGLHVTDAGQRVMTLEKELDYNIKVAENFSDEPETACGFLKKALKITPDDAALQKKIKQNKCK